MASPEIKITDVSTVNTTWMDGKLVTIDDKCKKLDDTCKKEGRDYWYFAGVELSKLNSAGGIWEDDIVCFHRCKDPLEDWDWIRYGEYMPSELKACILNDANIPCWSNLIDVRWWIFDSTFKEYIYERIKEELGYSFFDRGITKMNWKIQVVRLERMAIGKLDIYRWDVKVGKCIVVRK